ncbi:carboxylesterase/lipase family protein [Paractinoplanes lichenicola]|uniref:Carboxylic ester hydrolase n=1 Tax=Paractinoplanes lichenicola TaxID=2802976 RepID=A0ABS1VZ26_9ACTN|nr:carboxylesterase family protein [Actinoplanes lichenicola]MBL7259746.1 carboxylesterase family protein [Actinoplanes lichenicola]
MKRIASLLTMALLTMPACASEPAEPTAETRSGVVQGVRDDGVTRFRGIPYAAPPVGDLRWRAPQEPAAWNGVRESSGSGPACAQGPQRKDAAEDCLYLDVTAPADAEGKPVIVWLHGGGFSEGAGFDYDPKRMVAQGDVVVVTVEFRLGLYGFLGDNYGFLDQQAALRWVRDNIGEFGGDPGNVTLMGQSGGAIGACAQLTAPGARGLIHRAILQSGDCDAGLPKDFTPTGSAPFDFFRPVAETNALVRSTMTALGCADLDCLRGLPVARFEKEYAKYGAATYGVASLPKDPAVADHAKVPVLAGLTRNEQRLTSGIFAVAGWRMSAREYPGVIAKAFGAEAGAAIVREYPAARYGGDGAVAWGDVFTDSMACQTGTSLPGFDYEFADPDAQPLIDLPKDFDAGASHGSELPMLFEVAGRKPITSDYYTDAQRDLAAKMIGYWTAFARSGDPGWPAGQTMGLAPGAIGPVDVEREHRCDFWRALR